MVRCVSAFITSSKFSIVQFQTILFYFTVVPAILSDVDDSTDEGRDVANFTCQATGEPVPTISWYFDGIMIDVSDTSKYRIESRSINTTTTENTLTVYNVTSSNVGTYTCNATNIIGSDYIHGEITTNS